jgi:hypothetical protein
MTNCFWVAEDGTFETCIDGSLPPLPGDYVIWDATPEVLAGRALYGTYVVGSDVSQIGLAASLDIIVMGANSPWRGDATVSSYTVIVSDDHGFTFSGGIDKYPWNDGTGNGYHANWYDQGLGAWCGTAIAYDEEGGEFWSVDATMNDEQYWVSRLKTSRSTDGVNWTTVQVDDLNLAPVWCDAYNGTVWYLGYNYSSANDGEPVYIEERLSFRASDDGGLTWAGEEIGTPNFIPWEGNSRSLCQCSANAQGLHVIDNAYDYIGFETRLYYIRPTSKTTWAAPVVLWPLSGDMSVAYIGGGDALIASRANPGTIYVFALDGRTPYYSILYRKSADNGLTWNPSAVAWAGDATYDMNLSNSGSDNGLRVVELDDGRLVLITLGEDASSGTSKLLYAYAVNEDGMNSGFPAVTYLLPDKNMYDTVLAGFTERFEATNKGNDVLLVMPNDSRSTPQIGEDRLQRSLVFRP